MDYKWRGLAAMLLGTFTVVLSLSFLFPATPIIMSDFGVTIDTVAWLTLAYSLGATVFEPMWGRLGDMYGRKKNALLGLGLFAAGAVISALSPGIWVMVGARFVQGFGAAAIIPIGMAFVGENFPKTERGRALGLWGMVSGAAPALGPTIGGYLIDWFDWRAIYWASLLMGLMGIAVIALVVKESRTSRPEPFDIGGTVLLLLSVGSLLVAVNEGRSWGWTSPIILALLGSFALFTFGFLAFEKRSAHPIVDLKIVRSRLFMAAAATVLISFLAFQGSFFLIPFFLEQVQGYPASLTGQLAAPLFLGIMGASLLSGRLSDRVGARSLATCGTLFTALALYLLSLVNADTSYASLAAVMAILGVGIGTTLPPLSRAITNTVPLGQIGAATGIFNMTRNLGGPLGVALATTVFAQQVSVAGTTFVANRLAALGLPANALQDLPHLQDLARAGNLTAAHELDLLHQAAPQLQGLQQQAQLHALQSGFAATALVMLAISAAGIVAALLTGAGPRKMSWSPDAISVLARLPSEFRSRARSEIEMAARDRGLQVVTQDLVAEINKGWKNG